MFKQNLSLSPHTSSRTHMTWVYSLLYRRHGGGGATSSCHIPPHDVRPSKTGGARMCPPLCGGGAAPIFTISEQVSLYPHSLFRTEKSRVYLALCVHVCINVYFSINLFCPPHMQQQQTAILPIFRFLRFVTEKFSIYTSFW